MKAHTKEAIVEECNRIWKDLSASYTHGEVEVEALADDEVIVSISQMYAYVEMNLSHLMALAEFFDTKNINDSRYSYGGCETCDFGSSYTITLTIRPE